MVLRSSNLWELGKTPWGKDEGDDGIHDDDDGDDDDEDEWYFLDDFDADDDDDRL